MGKTWCRVEPEIRVNDHTVRAYCCLPAEVEDIYSTIDFTFRVPPGSDTEILWEEERETTTIIEDPEMRVGRGRGRRHDEGFEVVVEAVANGVASKTAALLLIVAPEAGICNSKHGHAGFIDDRLWLP